RPDDRHLRKSRNPLVHAARAVPQLLLVLVGERGAIHLQDMGPQRRRERRRRPQVAVPHVDGDDRRYGTWVKSNAASMSAAVASGPPRLLPGVNRCSINDRIDSVM